MYESTADKAGSASLPFNPSGQSNQAMVDVSVIVPCRNEAAHIARFMECLAAQSTDLTCEFIIGDGDSNDGTLAILRSWEQRLPNLRIIANPLRIVPSALNAAIRASRGDIILRMDVHAEYAPDYIQQCVSTLERMGVANVGGPVQTIARGVIAESVAAAYGSWFSSGGARFHDSAYEGYVDTVTFGCWKRSTFEIFGYFDESLVRNQDDEFNFRIISNGGRIWQTPAIKLWYRPRSTIRGLFKQYFQYGYWKVAVIRKHRAVASWRHLIPAAALVLNLLLLLAAVIVWLYQPSWFGLPAGVLAFEAFIYLALAILAGIPVSKRRAELLLLLPFIFLTYHLAYGAGFLAGIIHFRDMKDI